MTERWLPVPGYEGLYEVSNAGRVRALIPYRDHDGIIVGDVDRQGYRRVRLGKIGSIKRHKVHRLVCAAFHGPAPEETVCGHRDGDCTNNRAENLAWITRSENGRDCARHGRLKLKPCALSGQAHPTAKYSDEIVQAIRLDAASGLGMRRLSKKYGISTSQAFRIVKEINRKPVGKGL